MTLSLIASVALLPGWFGQTPMQAATPASTTQLDVEKLKQLLDRKDIAGAIQLLEVNWNRQYEDYYQGQLTTQVLDAEAMSQRLLTLFRLTGKRSALIYAVPTPNHLELILVPPGARPIHRRVAAADRTTLLQSVKAFRDEVMDPVSNRSAYLPPAQRLYQFMISPLEQDLKAYRIDTLIFCLGGGLRTLPLAALHDGNQFLIQKYNLAIIPAFNLLDYRPASLKGARVLAMGASQFEEQVPLPSVPLELSTIAANLWSGDVLLNQDFTLANLRTYRTWQLYRIVHLATHADFTAGPAQNSYIQFWDQRLSPDRFRELNLRYPEVQLLVLSACRTAVGNAQAELGFAGLAVMSGSKAAIATLWPVSDVGTLVLMTEFYQHLRTSSKTEALRQAQIALLNQQIRLSNSIALRSRTTSLPPELKTNQNTDISHPYYWAAFTVIGNAW